MGTFSFSSRACGECSAFATDESRTGPSPSSNGIEASALRMCISTWQASMQIRRLLLPG